ncbi:hypothetical protein [Oryzibacter oryziterrae]|uniref:hypothetical protein n=1 Tax=Oryzibacter oryziterrae TaxID=2766474 RepID=UPI001F1AD386|nr:hypothetical protein [Oryzibacter oryziterrae]
MVSSALVYLILSLLFCGGPLMPIALLTLYRSHLGAPHWEMLVVASAAGAAVGCLTIRRLLGLGRNWLPWFVAFWMCLSVTSVGLYAAHLRAIAVAEFQPDVYVPYAFVSSLLHAPADFQFALHAAALKDCKPYGWSYGRMAFYELPVDAAVNVLPQDWLERCSIHRKS